MTQHCTAGEKASVSYTFKNKKDIYVADVSPVQVTVESLSSELVKYRNSVVVPSGLGVAEVYLYGFPYITYPGCTKGYREILVGQANPGTHLIIQTVPSVGTENCPNSYQQNIPAINYYNAVSEWDGGSASIGLKFAGSNCKITIVDAANHTFKDIGLSPVNYTVACGDDCPDGYCKCHTTKYPGYCCLDCKKVANQINNLTQRL